MIEGSEDASAERSKMTEGDGNGSEGRIERNSSASDQRFLIVGGQAKSIFTSDLYGATSKCS